MNGRAAGGDRESSRRLLRTIEESVRRLEAALALTILLGIAGCGPVMRATGIPASDVSAVKVGATRAEVEHQMGQPRNEKAVCQGTERSYAFNRGMSHDLNAGQAAVRELGSFIFLPVDAMQSACIYECQRGVADVTYDRSDVVVGYSLREQQVPEWACSNTLKDRGGRCSSIQNRGLVPPVNEAPPDCETKEPGSQV